MFNSNKDIDLLVPYNYKESFYSKHRAVIKHIIPIACIIVVFIGGFIYLNADIHKKQQNVLDMQNNITDLQTKLALTNRQEEYNLYVQVDKNNKNLEEITTNLDSYPTLDKYLLVAIDSACSSNSTIKTMVYNYETATVDIYIETTDVTKGENVVRTLKSLHYFSSVSHAGYTGNETTTVTTEKETLELKYNMKITCVLEAN